MSLWQDLVSENPMLVEIQRFRRRFLSFRGNPLNSSALALGLLGYGALFLLVLNFLGDIPPAVLVVLQTVLFIFLGPAMLHASIAGEREKRTWDLLVAAPVTKAQIVAGKLIGALSALGAAAALFAVPMLLAAVAYPRTNYHDLALAEIMSLSFAVLVCTLTLFLSARCKRAFMALGATLGTLFALLLLFPLLIAGLGASDPFTEEALAFVHPVLAIVGVLSASEPFRSQQTGMPLLGWPHVMAYLALSVVLLAWTERTLRFADGEVKFISGGPSA